MTYFAVMIEAENLLVQTETTEEEQMQGCFCTRYLEAVDANEAASRAKKIVQSELSSLGIGCSIDKLVIESIEQLGKLPDSESSLGKGFTFYPAESQD